MRNLFAYGSLQFPEVMAAVIGHPIDGITAKLEGYRRFRLVDRSFPGIRECPGANCPGTLFFGVPPEDWSLLDAFEDHFYERSSLMVLTAAGPRPAEAYVVKEGWFDLLLDAPWDLEHFRQHDLAHFLLTHPPSAI